MDDVYTVFQSILDCDDFISTNEQLAQNLLSELKVQEDKVCSYDI